MTAVSLDAGLFGKDAGSNLTYNFADIGFSDSGRGSISDRFETDLVVVSGGVYYDVGMSYDLAFGLAGTANLNLGGLSGVLDFTTGAVASGKPTGAQSASVDTSGMTIDDNSFELTGPDFAETYIAIDMTAKLKADLFGKIGYDVDVWGIGDSGSYDVATNIVDIDYSDEIVRLSAADLAGADDELFAFDLGVGELHVGLPTIEFEGFEVADDADPLSALTTTVRSAPFLSFEVDLDSFLLPVGNAFDYGYDLGPLSFGLDTGILDAKVVASAVIEQSVTWDADVDVTMKTSLGETLTGELGDVFEFTTPEGEGSFTVTATYLPWVQVTTATTLVLTSSLDWKVGYGEVGVGVDIDIWQDAWKSEFSLIEGSEPLGDLAHELLSTSSDRYDMDAVTETYTVYYEKFVTAASGRVMDLTTHQVDALGGDIDNIIRGNALDNVIDGAGGADRLFGDAGADVLRGGAGNDRLSGGAGDDEVDGGEGSDFVTYERALAGVVVNLATGVATGEGTDRLVSIEHAIGSRFADKLTGNGLGARLEGGAGADRLIGGLAADGRIGEDVAVYRASGAGVTIDLNKGTGSGGDAAGDRLTNIDDVVGSTFADRLIGNARDNVLIGGGGADVIEAGRGDDRITLAETPAMINGGAGQDVLELTGGQIVLDRTNVVNIETVFVHGAVDLSVALDPSVRIVVRNPDAHAAARVTGGDGNDNVAVERGEAKVSTGAGDDRVQAVNSITVDGGAGEDVVIFTGTGRVWSDLTGVEHVILKQVATFDLSSSYRRDAADMVIDALGGVIAADAGDDHIRIGASGASVDGGYGDDVIELGAGKDRVTVSERDFGSDRVLHFDLAQDVVDVWDADIASSSLYVTTTDDGIALNYMGFASGAQFVSSIDFVGLTIADSDRLMARVDFGQGIAGAPTRSDLLANAFAVDDVVGFDWDQAVSASATRWSHEPHVMLV